MIAFASVVASPEKFTRFALPGLRRAAEPDSQIAEFTDAHSMTSAYNEIVGAFSALPDLEALVLLHEDTEIVDPAFCAKVRARLTAEPDIAVLGVVGAAGVRSLEWWAYEGRGRVLETRGLVDFGDRVADVDVLDGLLLVLSPWAVRTLRFDEERFPHFHGYDADICAQARAAGRRVAVDALEVVHHTKGGFGDMAAFVAADAAWRQKWVPAPDPLATAG